MAALTGDLNAPFKHKGPIRATAMAAGAKIFAGGLVAVNAAGFAVPASDTVGATVIGRAEEFVDNTTGGAGDKVIRTASGIFRYQSSGANKLTQVDIGKQAFVIDDQTVGKTAGNAIVAGIVWAIGTIYKEPVDSWYIEIR